MIATSERLPNDENPDLSTERLIEIIPAPDFPTGGVILGRSGIAQRQASSLDALISKTALLEFALGPLLLPHTPLRLHLYLDEAVRQLIRIGYDNLAGWAAPAEVAGMAQKALLPRRAAVSLAAQSRVRS